MPDLGGSRASAQLRSLVAPAYHLARIARCGGPDLGLIVKGAPGAEVREVGNWATVGKL